ncbi:uncharacterized protein [Epargyreus clarus]|uniref:uncharacterized protein n=1 Tax=Epargyreus clarus TaxID=520877 RepID=UPI003C2D5B95
MKPLLVLTSVVIILCVENVYASINNFISNLSHDVGNALQTAWTKVSMVIKRPVRIRRIGKGRRRKRTTALTSTVTLGPEIPTIAIYLFSKPLSEIIRPTIPVIPTPPFKSLVEWRKLQIPYVLRPMKGIKDPTTTESLKTSPDPMESFLKKKIGRKFVLFFT